MVKPNPNLKCECNPVFVYKEYDIPYNIETLIFARCEKHHVTTWGYQTKEGVLKAWKGGIVTDNYNFCEAVYD